MKEMAKKIVPPINEMPGKPTTKDNPGRGNAPADNKVATVKVMATMSGIVRSLLKNVTAMKNNEIGILKYCTPPQEAFAKPNISPPATAFTMAIAGRFLNDEIKR
jgi:hypothetical protein